MTYETLVKHCLQYLEKDSDVNVMEETIDDLIENDTFSEYMNNIETSIYTGLSKFATNKILPLKEFEVENGKSVCELKKEAKNGQKKPFAHDIADVYATDIEGKIITNVPYVRIGLKVILEKPIESYTYYVVYNPSIWNLREYADDLYSLDLEELGIPDEMAEYIKYLVYAEFKAEENLSDAVTNRNIFESYLNECATSKLENFDCEIITGYEMSDIYGF